MARRFAILGERKKTIRAEYRTDIARLAEDIAKGSANMAKQTARLILTVGGLIVAGAMILGFLICGSA
ncbi:MAG: hypothetical protein OXI87_07235 [Albidovulum sp.]|nr:hypothetical protein [Albidovulum sp.]MDE0304661.1 hypothetical protein [Albidovulum sp.]MDE0530406.1 hypothetical protein [Albidovulum sp.]